MQEHGPLRFQSLESLRAWAAWWVVLCHTLLLLGFSYDPSAASLPAKLLNLVLSGGLAVSIFIMLSGFVVTHLLLTQAQGYRPYIFQRAFRIFPIYLACLAIALLLDPFYMAAYTEAPWVHDQAERLLRAEALADNAPAHIGLHILMLHGLPPQEWLPYASYTILGPAWSLSLEWQFYLLLPALLALMRRGPVWRLAVAALILAAYAGLTRQESYTWNLPSFLPLSMPDFLLGISARMALATRGADRASWIAIGAASALFGHWLAVGIFVLFLAIALSEAGVFQLPRPAAALARLFALNPVLATMGRWSYSTYLIHIPLLTLFIGGGVRAMGEDLTRAQAAVLGAVAVALVLPASWLLYRHVERPFIRLGRRLARARTGRNGMLSVKAAKP